MGFIQEFKTFISRGNVIDMAVGVVIGAAFGKIVNALVAQVIMPTIGFLTGGMDFSDMAWTIQKANPETGKAAVSIGYGMLIQVTIEFLIIALSIFLVMKLINKLKTSSERLDFLKKKNAAKAAADAPAPAPAPEPTAQEKLLSEILDELRKANGEKGKA